MLLSRGTRIAARVWMIIGLAIIYVPLFVVLLNSVNTSRTFAWPPQGPTLEWWRRAADSSGMLSAIWTSVEAGLLATGVALVLGTMIAMGVQRYRFFGKDGISFLVLLPIALPGIVTGIALNNAFRLIFNIELGLLTVVIAHATFCVVIVYNNVLARLRRVGTSLEEASADLGADTFTTFRLVTFPAMRSALLAGALLAFALSFDEIVVTTFTAGAGLETLPLWIFNNLFRPNQAPVVNVVAACLIVASLVPVWLTQRLAGADSAGGRL